jgi:hypothetical protein
MEQSAHFAEQPLGEASMPSGGPIRATALHWSFRRRSAKDSRARDFALTEEAHPVMGELLCITARCRVLEPCGLRAPSPSAGSVRQARAPERSGFASFTSRHWLMVALR